ncbi:MAG TPA: amidohydrolase family protein [Chloroflexota bacterium]|nr:amidohydrolase family protein [Chloroflexota bacterium]
MMIDADAHVIESEATWENLAPEDRRHAPQAIADGGRDWWLIDGRRIPRGTNLGVNTPRPSYELTDVAARLAHLDALEIDVQVLYPTLFLQPVTARPEVQCALYRAYNRWLANATAQSGGRLRWAVLVPWLSIPDALEELRWGKAHGACAVFMRCLEAERRPHDPYFFPVYEEASRQDLPICIHTSTASFTLFELYGGDPVNAFRVPLLGAFHTVVYEEVPQRFPGLRFGFIEATSQWVPWQVNYLTQRLRISGRPPTGNILRDNRLYVTCETVDDVDYVARYAGEDQLVIGTDYSHADPSAELEALRRLRDEQCVAPGLIQKILDDNPRALYGL